MLQNEYLDAKIGVDTAENEPSRNSSHERLGGSRRALLVDRFDTELFSDFSAESSNFRGLVLFCIDADFCVQILILQHFSRSTRFAILCTAPNSKSQQKFDQLFQISAEISAKITIFQQFSWNFPPILMKIYRHFAKYFRKWSTSFKFHNF